MSLPYFDYLFALRLSYSDMYDSEHILIQKLREDLLLVEPNIANVNQHLIDFYNTYNITIDEMTINDGIIDGINNDMPELEPVSYYENMLNNVVYIPIHMPLDAPVGTSNLFSHSNILNMVTNIISSLNNDNYEFKDVVNTLDDSEFDKIKNYQVTEKKDECCSVCMDEFNIDDNASELPCGHLYHTNCITTYLKEYHRICPVCRAEVGKRKET